MHSLVHRAPRVLALAVAALAGVPAPGPAQPASHPLRCSFGSKTNGLDVAERCAARTPAGLVIAPDVLAALAYEHGLASLAVDGSWFYRRRDGRMMRMITFDMGPDGFAAGRARATIGGKLAYVDRRLRVRLRTRYDWGEPFAGGRAAVCIGCVEVRMDGGEHMMMAGGRWGVIDRHGRELVPVTLAPDKLPPNRR